MDRHKNIHPDINALSQTEKYWGWVGPLYMAGNDDGIALRLHHGYEYEPESRKLWRLLAKNAEIVIDVGAHTGIYSIDAWKAGAKKVVSIEPYHLNFARLLVNLRHSDFDCYSAVYCAAGDQNGIVQLSVTAMPHYCTAGGRISGLKEAEFGICSYPAAMLRLDDLLIHNCHHRVAVVKIDTEKHGLNVLRGMPDILSHKPDLILECIEEGMGTILKPLGYRFYRISETEGLSPVDDLIPDDPFTFDCPNRYATVKGLPDGL